MKYISTFLVFLSFIFAGCNTQPPQDFTLVFTMESILIYKVSIKIDKDKTYRISQQNMLFDSNPEDINKIFEGTMTDEEHSELSELIMQSRLFRMKNSYGFDKEPDTQNPLDGLIYQLSFTQGKKTKYISIRVNAKDTYPETFLRLIGFLNDYISVGQK